MSDETAPIFFSESFQLSDKLGVVHTFQLSGNLTQKDEILRTSAQSIEKALKGGWTAQATPATPTAPVVNDPNTTTETIMAELLIVSADETGTHFKIKGGRYKRHGVAIYPEYMEALGISPDMKPGAHEFKKRVVVQTTRKSDGTSCSKVTDLVRIK
jgi:hypothetical protein